jgi:hypothetical protein
MTKEYTVVPADTRRFSWRNPRGDVGFFQPNGGMTRVGDADLESNPTGWSSRSPIYAARIFVGFNVGPKPRWAMTDVVRIVKRIRKKQVGSPDATFLYQRGLYTSKKDDSVVDEKGAQIIILNLIGASVPEFRAQMLELAEEIATKLKQEEVIVEIQRGGISKETVGVTPVRQERRGTR